MKLGIKVGFLGFGRMGTALASGILSAKVLSAAQIWAYDPDASAKTRVKKLKVKAAKTAAQVVAQADLIFLCVKPQMMAQTLGELTATLADMRVDKKVFVSIAAGITIEKLETWLGKGFPILRVMPNTPALLNAGMSAVSKGKFATAQHEKWVKILLSAVGEVIALPEKAMDAVTALSGSGPAYVFYLAEAMMESAKLMGLDDDAARLLTHQTVYGAGRMLRERAESAEELRHQVTSPGGTTAAALQSFENQNFKFIVHAALQKAAERSKELSK
jgi:pyrroline-5-carboxylate reductase